MNNPDPNIEKILFRKIAEGNEIAFKELFHLYVPRLKTVIFRITESDIVVKDIIQDVFLGLWKDRLKLNGIENPSYWIFRIAYNHSYKYVKRQLLARNAITIAKQETDNTTEETIAFSETAHLIQEAIEALPEQSKKIFRLSREQGLKISDIAVLLNIAPQSVKNSLYRSSQQIREYLSQKDVLIPATLLTCFLDLFFS